jgi:uncharacterized membrane protein
MVKNSKWEFHPKVRSHTELTFGERAADIVRNGMGSWPFVFGALLFLTTWTVLNGHHGFDPYPFILLNLCLSCLAAMQGAILLIAAKRADQISSELAEDTYQTGQESLELIRQIASLTESIEELNVSIYEQIKKDETDQGL